MDEARKTHVSNRLAQLQLALALVLLSGGGVVWLLDLKLMAGWIWAAATWMALLPLSLEVARDLLRKRAGVDLIALMALPAALVFGEHLTGAVIGLMLATGRVLENYASSRAERELSSLLKGAPQTAHVIRDGAVISMPVSGVVPGDLLLVKDSDVVPVDGVLASASAMLDESALTGEARVVERRESERVMSGGVNAGPAFEMHATASAQESTYAGIVRLVRLAGEQKAPFVRLADRYALIFVPVTLATAGLAWFVSGDPLRALAVLVIATPCPLLLAAPIAIVSGVSRAARLGVIVKGGAVLEALGRGGELFLDKTGTLTVGMPRFVRAVPARPGMDEESLLRLAASLDQFSSHVIADALVYAARAQGLTLEFPIEVHEEPGEGLRGRVGERDVVVGTFSWVTRNLPHRDEAFRDRVLRDGASTVFVAVDGELAGALTLDDPIRPDTPRTIRALRRLGIARVTMLTGDHALVAESVGAVLDVDAVIPECSPQDKVRAVQQARSDSHTTLMVGDGINDAPALATADVGIAMGARGATSTSEAADVVILPDRLDRLVDVIRVAQRSRKIALQSVFLGMGLSAVGMGLAAFGFLTPIAGAILQEVVDVIAILNALRALGGGSTRAKRAVLDDATKARLRSEHDALMPNLDRFRIVADQLGTLPAASMRKKLDALLAFLLADIVAHERVDESTIYPAIAAQLEGDDPLASMSRTHQEIFRLSRRFELLLSHEDESDSVEDDLVELRSVLYGLHAILTLHFQQEEELYASVLPDYASAHTHFQGRRAESHDGVDILGKNTKDPS